MTELKSNIEWKQWGRDDPLFGVATWNNKDKHGASAWTDEEFYSLGRSDWEDFWRQWQHYGVSSESCLEVGCGAGRITKELSKTFRQVYAVDVSEDMIMRARKAVGSNVEFTAIDGIHLPQSDGSVTAIFSCHVLQHLDKKEIGYAYFREFYRVLAGGGTIMIHLPVYIVPGDSLLGLSFKTMLRVKRMLGHVRAGIKRRMKVRTMRMTEYPLKELSDSLATIGFKAVEFRIFATKKDNDLHPFVFAAK